MSDAGSTVALHVDGAVALLSLERASARNAMNHRMRMALHTALATIDAEESIRAVVLTGSGPVFCAGADLRESGSGSVERELLDEYRPCFELIATMDKPVIAAVAGSASGVGMSLALHCDLLLMAEDAVLSAPFIAMGLVPDGGAGWILVRELGYRRAFALLLDGGQIPARQALALGLANAVIAAGTLRTAALAMAGRLASLPRAGVAGTKRIMRGAVHATFDETYAKEAATA